jgi:uncharacterized membrane protein
LAEAIGVGAPRVLDLASVRQAALRVAPHLPVLALIVAYAMRFSLLSVAVHDGYDTPAYDMGLFDQGIWLLSRFHAPFVTVMGRNLFGDHTCFILLLVVPLFWVYPHAQALLVLQSWALAAAAVPIYLIGRKLLGRGVLGTTLATAMAATYLLNPALQNGNLEQFHPECLMVLALAIAVYAAVDWHPRLLIAAAIAALLCKQDTALMVIPLALWVAWRRDRRLGLILAGAAAAWMAIAFLVIINLLLGTTSFNMARVPFGGFTGFVKSIFTKPRQVWDYVTSQGRLFYLWQMGSSVGWMFVVGPSVALIAALTFLENELADFVYMHQIQYHYSMPIVPVLVIGTVWALSRIKPISLRVAAGGVATCSAFIGCVLWGLAPFSVHDYAHQSSSAPAVRDANQVIKALPSDAVVSAWYPYISHIDHRTRVYMWPTPFSAKYWGTYHTEGQRLPFADQIQYVLLPTELAPDDKPVLASIASQYTAVEQVGGVVLYEKISYLQSTKG